MTSVRYRKRPVEIEARQLLGSEDGIPAREIAAWCGGWLSSTFREPKLVIPTLEGDMIARPGDWIIRGVKGEFYPCRDDIFAETYEPAAVPSVPADPSETEEEHAGSPAAEEPAACGKCRQPFDPADVRADGRSQYRGTPYCRICVNRCHDTEIADHRCVICA